MRGGRALHGFVEEADDPVATTNERVQTSHVLPRARDLLSERISQTRQVSQGEISAVERGIETGSRRDGERSRGDVAMRPRRHMSMDMRVRCVGMRNSVVVMVMGVRRMRRVCVRR